MTEVKTRTLKKEKIEKMKVFMAMQGNPREAVLLAYFAGILDGEGCIGIKKYLPYGAKRSITYFVFISMGMQFKEVPMLFQKTFGGSCNEERHSDKKSMWRWQAQGKEHVSAILRVLLPYLRVKKEQAEFALYCCETWKLQERNGKNLLHISESELLKREDAYQKMRKLKH